jgi:integrase
VNKYPQIARNLSVTFLNSLLRHRVFDGLNGAHSPCEFKDTNPASKGLMLRLNPSGKMTFFIKGKLNNPHKKIGRTTFFIGNAREMDLHTARERAGKYNFLLQKGMEPADHIDGLATAHITLNTILEEYIHDRSIKIKERTIKNYRYRHSVLSKIISEMRIDQVTTQMIVDEHVRIGESTQYIADQAVRQISFLINYAQNKYIDPVTGGSIVKSNPVDKFRSNKHWFVNNGKSRRKVECIDTEALPDLLDGIDALQEYKDGVKYKHQTSQNAIVASHFFKFLLFTGWRPEEVVKIKWIQVSKDLDDISWDDKQAYEALKNAEEKYRCPLNSYAIDVLKSIRNHAFESSFVFPNSSLEGHFKPNPSDYIDALEDIVNNNKRYTSGIYRKSFQTYAEACNLISSTIKRLVFHTQKVYDIQSGYIKMNREVLRKHSQKVGDYIMYSAGRIPDRPIFINDKTNIDNEQLMIYSEIASNIAIERNMTTAEVLQRWLKIGMNLDTTGIGEHITVKQLLATI